MGSLFEGKYSQWGNTFLPITETYLEPSQKSTMKHICKKIEKKKAVNYFRKKLDRRFQLDSKYSSELSPC